MYTFSFNFYRGGFHKLHTAKHSQAWHHAEVQTHLACWRNEMRRKDHYIRTLEEEARNIKAYIHGIFQEYPWGFSVMSSIATSNNPAGEHSRLMSRSGV